MYALDIRCISYYRDLLGRLGQPEGLVVQEIWLVSP